MSKRETNLDRLLRARAEIEEALRRHKSAVTIFFSDIVGSTAYFSRYGDTAGMAMLQRHSSLATGVVSQHGGSVIKTIGDSVMAEFPEPVLAVKAAVEIQRELFRLNPSLAEHERVQIRIGLHTGTAFRHDHDLFGDAVNLAARITKRTGPAQILISRAVREAVASDAALRFNLVGRVPIEGRPDEDLFEVVWTDTASYADLREHITQAIARGELMGPGVSLDEVLTPGQAPGASETTPQAAVTALQTAAVPHLPAALTDRYEILGEAGSGGVGIVYKARDRETGEVVALKVLRPEVAEDAEVFERFKNELRLARKITNKHVCRIHDFLRVNGLACISMEFVEGESLRQVLGRFGGLGLRKGLQVARQICEGLREAHAQGIVHRDLKPENVMLDRAGNVKLMDFGIARSAGTHTTSHGAVVGTPAYMAPEQAEGKAVDHRADIYALGLILYEVFTGSPAFTGDTPVALAVKQIRETPPRPRQIEPSLPDAIESIILKCIEKDPAKRFQTVEELAGALEATEAANAAAAKAFPIWRLAVAGLVAAGLLGAFGLGWKLRHAPPAQEASSTAPQQAAGDAPSKETSAPAEQPANPPVGGAQNPVPLPGPATVASPSATSGNGATAAPIIARNAKELAELKRRGGDMAYFDFHLKESNEFTEVGPVGVRLNKADTKRQMYTVTLQMKENRVEMRDRGLFEPLRFYHDESRQMMEVVVFKIQEKGVQGYLTAPKSVKVPKKKSAPPAKPKASNR